PLQMISPRVILNSVLRQTALSITTKLEKEGGDMIGITIKTKIQTIAFETQSGDLGKTFATSDKRITIAEAGDILLDRAIEYKQVLKVKYENVDLEIPLGEFENYLL